MRILVGCECSQIVTSAFLDKGHDAYSCDILPSWGKYPERHIQDDVLRHLDDGWDMLIAFPPCTYLCRVSAPNLYNSDGSFNFSRYEKLLSARDFFLELYNAPIDKICLENPIPLKIANLPVPSDLIQPYNFGHDYSKATYLWLKNLPPLFSTDICIPEYSYVMSTSSQFKRSIFHPGIAAAMADQWG